MALRIRLQRHGSTHRPFYRVVVSENTARRDGRFVEVVGTYEPQAKRKADEIKIKLDRVDYWRSVGALPTDTAASLIRKARRETPEEEAVVEAATAEPAAAEAAAPEAAAPEAAAPEAPAPEAAAPEAPAPEAAATETAPAPEAPTETEPKKEAASETPAEPAAESDSGDDATKKAAE